MVFDEATSSLDSLTEEEIGQTIREVGASEDVMTILIAHRLSTIMHADRILVVENGTIVESGRHEELLRKGGRYVLCGLYGGELVHPLPPIAQRAIAIVGSYVGSLQELKEVVGLAKKRKLKPLPIETRPAAQANAALEDLKAGRIVGRVVLDFETVEA